LLIHSTSMRVVNYSNTSSNNDAKDVSKPKIPRGLRSLPMASYEPPTTVNGELNQLKQDAAAIESWWTQSRWKHTKRVYSGE
jgi:hypothetical protein